MQNLVYPVILNSDKDSGGFVVRFVDLPEAITQGENIQDALSAASDCLEEAIANRIVMGLPIPRPSRIRKGDLAVPLAAQMAAKAVLHIAMQKAKISKVDLARRLQCDEREVRRLLDPHHQSKLPRIEFALAAIGRKLVVGFVTQSQ